MAGRQFVVSQDSHPVVRTNLWFSGHWAFHSVSSSPFGVTPPAAEGRVGGMGSSKGSALPHGNGGDLGDSSQLPLLFISSGPPSWAHLWLSRISLSEDLESETQGLIPEETESWEVFASAARLCTQWSGCSQWLPASCFSKAPLWSYTFSHIPPIDCLI